MDEKKPKRVDLPRLCILLYLIMVQSDLVEKAKTHEAVVKAMEETGRRRIISQLLERKTR